ncbi:MAG: PAS-domain containing protein [Pseudomonadota bacterium]
MFEFSLPAALGLIGLVLAASTLILATWARYAPTVDEGDSEDAPTERLIYLFDGEVLTDCTPNARAAMAQFGGGGSDLGRVLHGLRGRFAELPESNDTAGRGFAGPFRAKDAQDDGIVRFQAWDGYTRITVDQSQRTRALQQIAAQGPSDELATLRSAADHAPILMWQVNDQGAVSWANEAYLAELRREGVPGADHWPPPALFPDMTSQFLLPAQLTAVDRRQSGARSFDITGFSRDGFQHFFASSADDIVKAERARRNFVQTLTKTFSHLSTGLAIFDQERKLVLFNPALMDLLSLKATFLSRQPSLESFLDQLRDDRMLAEPKNYKAWRRQLVELEAQAVSGSYCESWSLPGGVTYRVTGRPHPDGAIAFLFEDISSDVSLTQRFHSEIELGHAALDVMEEGVAVVSSDGVVTFTNAGFRKLWHTDIDESIMPTRLTDAVALWREQGGDPDVWAELEQSVYHRNSSAPWTGDVMLSDGRRLRCRTVALGNGATLIGCKELGARGTGARPHLVSSEPTQPAPFGPPSQDKVAS